MTIYELSIVSWTERGLFAEHYYGYLRYDPKIPGQGIVKIELEHRVRKDDPKYYDSLLHGGRKTFMTIRFATKEQIRKAARKWMFENAKPGDLLQYDSSSRM